MKYEVAYRTAVEHNWNSIGWLFQRLNFFLIATAFLITAFVASLSYGPISLALCGTGLALSLVFTILTYHNTKIIAGISEYIRELESKNPEDDVPETELPSLKTVEIVNKLMVGQGPWTLIWELLCEIRAYLLVYVFRKSENGYTEDVNRVKRSIAPHTYAIPLFFFLVWLALLLLAIVFV